MSANKLFIIEKNFILASSLRKILEEADLTVTGLAENISEAIPQLQNVSVDIVLIDIDTRYHSPPDAKILVTFKEQNPQTQILFLSASTDEKTVSLALECKSCAFLIKPYRDIEIILTIRMILSRARDRSVADTSMIVFQKIYRYDIKKQTLWKNDHQILLTPSKTRLVEILVANLDTTVSNHQICNYIWGEHRADSTLRTLIYRTKACIGDAIITNVNGVGYSINAK